jgi:hypothetical protein
VAVLIKRIHTEPAEGGFIGVDVIVESIEAVCSKCGSWTSYQSRSNSSQEAERGAFRLVDQTVHMTCPCGDRMSEDLNQHLERR